MLADYHILSVTYNDLNVSELGHFMIDERDGRTVSSVLDEVRVSMGIEEIIYLATCNRVEYICYYEGRWTQEKIEEFFSKINSGFEDKEGIKLGNFVNIYSGIQAVNHLFEVASSMDSMVVGEREIFRQFRKAYQSAIEDGRIGDNLRLLEKFTVKTAKDIYAHTKIGEKPLSIVSLAIQKILKAHVARDARILMVGAGETNTLVSKFLKKFDFSNVAVFNRNIDNAAFIQQALNANAYHLNELESYKEGFDVMIISTGSRRAIITDPLYQSLIAGETATKMIVDLSVPRNVEESVFNKDQVNYIDIEQLRVLAEDNLKFRKIEVEKGKVILAKKLEEFKLLYQQRQIEKAMAHVPSRVKDIKDRALNEIFNKKLSELDENTINLIGEMMDYMEKKFISVPMKLAKESLNEAEVAPKEHHVSPSISQ